MEASNLSKIQQETDQLCHEVADLNRSMRSIKDPSQLAKITSQRNDKLQKLKTLSKVEKTISQASSKHKPEPDSYKKSSSSIPSGIRNKEEPRTSTNTHKDTHHSSRAVEDYKNNEGTGSVKQKSKPSGSFKNRSSAYQVDLGFVMDATGSMWRWIHGTKEKIIEIIQRVRERYPETEFRFAIVVYRDFDQGDKSIQVYNFTSNPEEIIRFLESIKATGGGDEPEDINGGFRKVLKLNWQSFTKVLVHFGDAPCHGEQFNDSKDEQSGYELPWEQIFDEMKSIGIDYYFMKLNKSTDKMITKFTEMWNNNKTGQNRAQFNVYPISTNTKDLVDNIVRSVKMSIRRSITQMGTQELKNYMKENRTNIEEFQSHLSG